MLSDFKKNKLYYISTLSLALPIIVSQIGHTVVQMADAIIVGQLLGRIPLAAVSLVHSLFMVILVFGLGLSFGLTPLISHANGKKDTQECARLLANSFCVNLVTGLLLFCFIYFGALLVIDHLNQDPLVVQAAIPYLGILGISIVPLMVFSTFKHFAEGLGFTRQAMQITIWGNLLNIVLALVLVKGWLGFEKMGLSGVGIATLIDRILMMLVMGIYVFRSKNFKKQLSRFSIFKVDLKGIKNLVKIGGPIGLQYVFEISAFACAALIAGYIGSVQQAAHQTAIVLVSTTYLMGSGIASAATIKIGYCTGKKNYERLKIYVKTSYVLIIVFMLFCSGIFILFNNQLPKIITLDPEVISISAGLLIIAGMFQLFDGTQNVGLGILRGMKDVRTPTIITFISYWGVCAPAAYLFGITLDWGIKGVWYGLVLGLVSSAFLLFWRYKYLIGKRGDSPNKYLS